MFLIAFFHSFMTFSVNGYKVKSSFGVDWLLIFYHNSTFGHFFSSHEEALFVNSPHLFSILQYSDSDFVINGSYEYLLEYPEVDGFIHWTQTFNAIDNVSDVGYSPISTN